MELSELAKLAYNASREYYLVCIHHGFRDDPNYTQRVLNELDNMMPKDIENHEDYYKVQALVLNILTKHTNIVYGIQYVLEFMQNTSTLPWVHHHYWDEARDIANSIFFAYVCSSCQKNK